MVAGIISNPMLMKGGVNFLLDADPNSAFAVSLRKLRSVYTGNCIKVRRSSDNAEQDIGFVGNVLDTANLLSFCGAGSGFIRTWYDQSGNSNNANQTTAGNQPKIVSSGALITYNGKPTIQKGSDEYLLVNDAASLDLTAFYAFIVFRGAGVGSTMLDKRSLALAYNGYYIGTDASLVNAVVGFSGIGVDAYGVVAVNGSVDTQYLWSLPATFDVTMEAFVNGVSKGTDDISEASSTPINAADMYIGANLLLTPGNGVGGEFSEIVLYPTASENGSRINSNIKTFYGI